MSASSLRAELSAAGIRDADRAEESLESLAGQGVTDDDVEQLRPSVLAALTGSPDPDRALHNFVRWYESLTNRVTHLRYILQHPAALEIFFNVCGVSQFFSDILVRNPEYFEILANQAVRGAADESIRTAARFFRELSGFVEPIQQDELRMEAMRRFKLREVLRIGTRDILGLADMPATAREFSNLADACVQMCLQLADDTLRARDPDLRRLPLAVIAMGKLGGIELNYSSDIDLMFVCAESPEGRSPDSDLDRARRLAERLIQCLTRDLGNGHLFRVDVRLRPEGRFGPLVRTLGSYQAYYESWAEPWELQAMIKARPIAGDAQLGDEFIAMTRPFVYRRAVTAELVDAVRENKRRIERRAASDGVSHTNVKTGVGGIRDVEFTTQLLQLELGGRDALLRTPNTLEALGRLRQAEVVTPREEGELSEDYQYLRTIEHRLQILYDRQTQELPANEDDMRLLARRLGYTAADDFRKDYARRTARVNWHFNRLFYGESTQQARNVARADPWAELITSTEVDPLSGAKAAVTFALEAEGFRDPERAAATVKAAAFGGDYGRVEPSTSEAFLAVAGALVRACARTGDPDTALEGVDVLAQSSPNAAAFYRMLQEGGDLLDRLCRLAAGNLTGIQSLARHSEWFDLLVSEDIEETKPKSAALSYRELVARLPPLRPDCGSGSQPAEESRLWDALAQYIQRERLRISARDLWGVIGVRTAGRELTALAEAVIQALLDHSVQALPKSIAPEAARRAQDELAVIGLGRLGGAELGYGSDWDILFVVANSDEEQSGDDAHAAQSEGRERELRAACTAIAEFILGAAAQLRTRGAPVVIDARLRQEGRKGALVYSVADYSAYYASTALTWERQALSRARPVAGSQSGGSAFMELAAEVAYGAGLSDDERAEIVAMKRRIEAERLSADARHTDLKLGYGGLSDIEFTAQALQMTFGTRAVEIRAAGTVEALQALTRAGALSGPDAAVLIETHRQLSSVRNRLSLLAGAPVDKLPDDPARMRTVAIGLGETDTQAEAAGVRLRRALMARMTETRSIVGRLLYKGETAAARSD